MDKRSITPRKQYQEIRTIVSLPDVQLDPDRHPTLHISNIFGRVFAYMIAKVGGHYQTLRGDTDGELLVTAGLSVLGYVDYTSLALGATWDTATLAVGYDQFSLYLTEGNCGYQFVPVSGEITGPHFLPAGQIVNLRTPFYPKQVKAIGLGASYGTLYINYWRKLQE